MERELIDLNELRRWKHKRIQSGECSYDDMVALGRFIEDVPRVDVVRGEWIPCSERMPRKHGTYIVSGKMKYDFEYEYEHFVDAAEYDPYDSEFNTWNDWYEGQDEFEILAWMPLPKPKGVDDE